MVSTLRLASDGRQAMGGPRTYDIADVQIPHPHNGLQGKSAGELRFLRFDWR